MDSPIDWTKPVETIRGEPYRLLCTDGPDKDYPVVGIFDGAVDNHTMDGKYYIHSKGINQFDLRNIPEPPKEHKLEVWKLPNGRLLSLLDNEIESRALFVSPESKLVYQATFKENGV